METEVKIGRAKIIVEVPEGTKSATYECIGIHQDGDYETLDDFDYYLDETSEFAEDFAFALVAIGLDNRNRTTVQKIFFVNILESKTLELNEKLTANEIGNWKIKLPNAWYEYDEYDEDDEDAGFINYTVENLDFEDEDEDIKIYDSKSAFRHWHKYTKENNLVRRIYEAYKFCKRAKDFKRWREIEEQVIPGTVTFIADTIVPKIQSSAFDELIKLIGINSVKEEIKSLINFVKFRKARLDAGHLVSPSTLHLVFTGNPGTGKTTVARLISRIYKDIGLLTKGHLIEVTRGDLVGQFVGQTAPQTKKKFEEALGGVLFIDEAYSLYYPGVEQDFGLEVINTLVALMENYREQIVVIVAGYPDKMKVFLESNPGLESRLPTKIHFVDYTKEELHKVFLKMCTDKGYQISSGAASKLLFYIEKQDYSNNNARGIRNLFDIVEKNLGNRVMNDPKSKPTREELNTITEIDIPDPES
ncbi:MAG: AAA family ATPase [Sphingobacteriales bacterium]|nr:MAG: AAA family ATPase [Sphingobacteriales bacterium]